MKKLLLVSFISFLFNSSNLLQAQTGWVAQTNPLGLGDSAMLGKVQFVSSTEGWISCGNGGLLHTTNAGAAWSFVNPFPADTVTRFSDPAVCMSWVGTTHGWIIGTIGTDNNPHGAVIFYTTNSGVNWQKKILTSTPGDFGFQIQFVNINTGWLLIFNFTTQAATFLKTTDGGNNWVPFNGAGIFYFVNANNGWAYSGSGQFGSEPPYKILRTTNGGTDWTEQFSDNQPGSYNAMHFTDVNNGWVVGDTGKVLKTTNGGANWNFVTNTGVSTSEHCKTVFFLDANTGWIPTKANDIQQTPVLQHTTNGGISWITQSTPFGNQQGNNAIFSIYFVNAQTGWITGDWGRIAKYSGTTDINDDVNSITEFSLKQNFPNPFNPVTSIQYTIGSNRFVQMKVYDVIGNEVVTLVNEEQSAGNYEVEFDATSLSSGIYFYQLKSGSYLETKKMIILK